MSNSDENNGHNNGNGEQSQQQLVQPQPIEQQTAVVYPISIKLEQDPKGRVKCSVHCHSNDEDTIREQVVRLFVKTQDDLKGKGINVLE
ncbi:MAG TPA: hypothetical protein VE223_03915 [Nitrososphaeraceae archaeon]|nr:hypothetical protein [Nitrososphaeraceae archaeon]